VKPGSAQFAAWEQAIGQVRKGMTKTDVHQILGPVSKVVSSGAIEILAYRLEKIGDAFYSIRVAFSNGLVDQCYMGYELDDSVGPHERTIPNARAAGAFALLAGAVLAYLGIYQPISNAAQGKTVTVSLMVTAIVPVVFLIGGVLTIFGGKSGRVLGTNRQPSRLGLFLALIFVILGLLLYGWVTTRVSGYGVQ
jgi:hypothetical protein